MQPSFDWSSYTGNLKWLQANTVFLTVHGSHAYGTSTPESDLDIRGCVVPPREYNLGFLNNFEQATQKDPDFVIFAAQKFVSLAADNNPNVLELLFVPEHCHIQVSPEFRPILENRGLFPTKRSRHSLSGFAMSQLRRIQLHRGWLIDPPKAPPTREEFDLFPEPEVPRDQLLAAKAAIEKRMAAWSWQDLDTISKSDRQHIKDEFYRRLLEITKWGDEDLADKLWIASVKNLSFNSNFIEYLAKERKFTAAKKRWESYQTWLKERNPKRAELEAKFGYDTKHAAQLVRLFLCCEHLLRTGEYLVHNPDVVPLLQDIRYRGIWPYDQLLQWAKDKDSSLDALMTTTTLPETGNVKALDKLLINLTEAVWARKT